MAESLLTKRLGMKPGQRVLVLDAPEGENVPRGCKSNRRDAEDTENSQRILIKSLCEPQHSPRLCGSHVAVRFCYA